MDTFDGMVRLDRVKLIHLNDSKGPLGSGHDRHEHVGFGLIGTDGLGALLHHKQSLDDLPIIMEPPTYSVIRFKEEVELVRALVGR